jgi:transcriptional regulator with XRE-family HTH domain
VLANRTGARPMNAEWFAGRLKELRSAAGLTQQQLADKAGLAVGVIRKLEQQENKPTWETALILCQALGVDCTAFTQPPAERPAAKPGRPRKQPPPVETKPAKKPRKRKEK